MKTSILRTALISMCLLSGCATPMFNVTSSPVQADVFYQVPGTTERKQLGQTPLSMPMAELRKALGAKVPAGEVVPLTVEKKGFESETVAIPASRFGTMVTTLDVKLKTTTTEAQRKDKDKQANTAKVIVDRLFLAQRFALTAQFERAQAEIDRILEDYPNFARAMSMRASIYYAQKNLPESLKWYERALKADPQMDDAVKMSARIRGVAVPTAAADNSRVPASPAPEDGVAPAAAPAEAEAAPAPSAAPDADKDAQP